MVYIAYHTESDLQVYNYEQKRRICRKNSEYAPYENFYGHFCSRGKAANFCHPELWQNWLQTGANFIPKLFLHMPASETKMVLSLLVEQAVQKSIKKAILGGRGRIGNLFVWLLDAIFANLGDDLLAVEQKLVVR